MADRAEQQQPMRQQRKPGADQGAASIMPFRAVAFGGSNGGSGIENHHVMHRHKSSELVQILIRSKTGCIFILFDAWVLGLA